MMSAVGRAICGKASRLLRLAPRRTLQRSLASGRWWPAELAPAVTSRALSSGRDDLPQMVDMKQGNKRPNIFTEEEFVRRLSKLRAHMAEAGLGAVVLTSYHAINYYSGFVFCYFGRSYGLVVTPEDSCVISAGIDGGKPWRRAYGDSVTYTDWQKDNFFRAVKKVFETRAVHDKAKIGLEFDHVTADNLAKFDAALPGNEKVDVGDAAMRLRLIKTPEEISVIRQGARIADLGGEEAVKALAEGVPEHEVALASTDAMVREIAKTYPQSDIMDTWVWFQSGIDTDGAHNPVTTRKVQKGDILSLNCFPMIQGYYTALERTLFLDHVSDAQLRVWEINCEVHRRGLELIQPGVRCCDIAADLNDLYRQHDMLQYRSFGYGHSFGTLCHYFGREAAVELREDIKTELQPGMVVSMEPMVMIPEGHPAAGGYREHDILIVKESGTENITKFPFGPEHNVIRK